MGKGGLAIIVLFLALLVVFISGCVKIEQPVNETGQNITVSIVPEEKINISKVEMGVLSNLESGGWASIVVKVEENQSISDFIDNLTTNLSERLNVTGRFSNGFSAEATKEAIKKLSNNENIKEIYYYESASAQLNADSNLCKNDYECIDKEICLNHGCKKLNCGQCYYTSNHSCVKTECCTNDDCKSSQICLQTVKICIPLACGFCQYAENHTCLRYDCCEEKECKNTCFYHRCIDAPTTISFEGIEKGNTRTTNRIITDYSILKNFDIGLLLIQTKEEWNNTQEILSGMDLSKFSEFKDYFLLMVLQHGKMPADVKIEKIKQGIVREENTLFVYLNASENTTGIADDAWHIIKIRRDNLTDKNGLFVRITPTGKMIVGGEAVITGVNIAKTVVNDTLSYCENITIHGMSEVEATVKGRSHFITAIDVGHSYGGPPSLTMSVDRRGWGDWYTVEEGKSIKVDDIKIDVNELVYWCKEGCYLTSAELGVCYVG